MKLLPLAPLALLALLTASSTALGDTVTGRVVDSTGAPVQGVNIDAIRVSNGNDENILNDGTNANGEFTSTINAGVYDFYFFAPRPPATTHVAGVVRNVVVAGTKALGTIQLRAGSSLSGRVLNPAGVPVGGVNLEVIDLVTGNVVPIATTNTDAFGNFNLAVPKNALELRLDASDVPLQTLVSRVLNATPLVNTSLGNLALEQGLVVTGHVQRATNATSVANVDLDFVRSSTGERIFTPSDNTNTLGNFSVVVPAGTYDIDLCPPFSDRLVGGFLGQRSITASTSLGNIPLQPGFVLSGKIRSSSGVAQVGADVDARLNGVPVNLCGDNSNAAGDYAVIVPAGTLKITFHPPSFELGLGNDIHKNFVVTGDTLLDGSLPPCPAPTNYGVGLAGTGGFVPHLTSSGGAPAAGNQNFALELMNGRGGATAYVMLSAGQNAQPLLGGTLLVRGGSCCSIFFPVTLGGAVGVGGAGSKRITLPFSLSLAGGFTFYAQSFVVDPGAVQGWAFSEGLRVPVCR